MLSLQKILGVLIFLTATSAQALVLTDLSGITTSAGSCYTGCGHAQYDHSNIIDKDFGATGNTGFNSWNSGFYGGWVQIDFLNSYVLDRIELYGGSGYLDNYSLLISNDNISWASLTSGSYHNESRLHHGDVYSSIKYGAVHDVADATLPSDKSARYLRYNVGAGPHWGYLFELVVDGHVPVTTQPVDSISVPEPSSLLLLLLGFAVLILQRRKYTD